MHKHKHKPKPDNPTHEELEQQELDSTPVVATEHPAGCTCAWCQYWADSSRALEEHAPATVSRIDILSVKPQG